MSNSATARQEQEIVLTPIRIILALSLLILLFLLGTTSWYFIQEREQLLRDGRQQFAIELQQQGQTLLSKFELLELLLQRLAVEVNQTEVMGRNLYHLAEIITKEKTLIPYSSTLLLSNSDGQLILSSDILAPGTERVTFCPPFPHTNSARQIEIAHWGEAKNGEKCMLLDAPYFSYKLLNQNGEFKGELVAVLSSEIFVDNLLQHLPGLNASAIYRVNNRDGQPLYRHAFGAPSATTSDRLEEEQMVVSYLLPGYGVELQLRFDEKTLLTEAWSQLRKLVLGIALLLFAIWSLITLFIFRAVSGYQIQLEEGRVRLNSALRFAKIGAWELEVTTETVSWDEQANQILRVDQRRVVIDNLQQLIDYIYVSDRTLLEKRLERAIREGEAFDMIFRIEAEDGDLRWIHSRGNLLCTSDGQPLRLLGVVQDETARHHAEAALHYQNMLYRTLFDSMTDAIIHTDIDRHILTINSALTTIFGYTIEDLLGHTTSILYESREEYERQGRIRFNLSADEQLKPYVVTYRRRDGTLFPGETTGRKLINQQGKVIGFIGVIHDISERVERVRERKLNSMALEKQRKLTQHYLDIAPVLYAALNEQGNIRFINSTGSQMLGYRQEDLQDRNWFETVIPERSREEVKRVFGKIMLGSIALVEYYQNSLLNSAGEERIFAFHNTTLHDERGKINGVLFAAEDVTERQKSERNLRQAQKLEAIGQLTGGIAHDFNNILGIILGNVELLQRQLKGADPKIEKRLLAVAKSGQRAAKLTQQLLGFSRRKVVAASSVDLNRLIQGLEQLIERSLTPEIEVKFALSEGLLPCHIDAGDFEDLLLNLCLNARDAMAGRGHLTLETRNLHLDDEASRINRDLTAGEYIELAVSDDGSGMSAEVQERLFEPFFTTKESGTGLGLAMVFGFVKRSKGHISCYSEEGIGTTIRILLPALTGSVEVKTVADSGEGAPLPRGEETLLLVDDEPELLEVAAGVLEELGYRVGKAASGQQALERLQQDDTIALMVSDVVMPGGMNGYELAERATALRPQLRVLLCSGYTDHAMAKNGQARFATHLLTKPYSQQTLAERVRQLLDDSDGG
ncbi:MAG: PAS domain S-box protein [Gammaproteobacteria bacterium]|nr:PAS domain S-box protein [Gammaproteobacteria bacterium]